MIAAYESKEYFVRNGRASGQNTALQGDDEVVLKWKHVAPNDVRIDPSISNIVEMLVLTESYSTEIKKYKKPSIILNLLVILSMPFLQYGSFNFFPSF